MQATQRRIHETGAALLVIIAALILSACSSIAPRDSARVPDTTPVPPTAEEQDGPPDHIPPNLLATPDAVPRDEALSRTGNPERYSALGQEFRTLKSNQGYVARGKASWYGKKFHGRRTSSGEPYDMFAMTAAHPTLPIPSYARITNLENGKSVVVRVNDRGPFAKTRITDVSYTAATKLGMLRKGTALVEMRAIETPQSTSADAVITAHPPAAHGVILQAGAFASRDNAERLRAQIEATRIAPAYLAAPRHGAQLYRVHVGPLAAEERDAIAQRLGALGIHTQIARND
jgi:rare lipoprotein A